MKSFLRILFKKKAAPPLTKRAEPPEHTGCTSAGTENDRLLASFCKDPERDAEFIRYIAVSRADEGCLQRLVHLTALLQFFKILGRFVFVVGLNNDRHLCSLMVAAAGHIG